MEQKIHPSFANVSAEKTYKLDDIIRALEIASKIVSENEEDNADIMCLIHAEKETVFDQKIKYLRSLINRRNYSIYAKNIRIK